MHHSVRRGRPPTFPPCYFSISRWISHVVGFFFSSSVLVRNSFRVPLERVLFPSMMVHVVARANNVENPIEMILFPRTTFVPRFVD